MNIMTLIDLTIAELGGPLPKGVDYASFGVAAGECPFLFEEDARAAADFAADMEANVSMLMASNGGVL